MSGTGASQNSHGTTSPPRAHTHAMSTVGPSCPPRISPTSWVTGTATPRRRGRKYYIDQSQIQSERNTKRHLATNSARQREQPPRGAPTTTWFSIAKKSVSVCRASARRSSGPCGVRSGGSQVLKAGSLAVEGVQTGFNRVSGDGTDRPRPSPALKTGPGRLLAVPIC